MKAAPLLVLLAPALAHAEDRATTITIAGMLGGIEPQERPPDVYVVEPDPLVGPRVTLSWEHPALALPPSRGFRFATALVPELVGGAFIDDVRAQAFLGAGVRAELKMAQREMGLFKMSARGAIYLAGRGMVVGDARKPFGEIAFGEYFLVGHTARIGFDFALVVTSEQPMDAYDNDNMRIGGVVQLFVGWQP